MSGTPAEQDVDRVVEGIAERWKPELPSLAPWVSEALCWPAEGVPAEVPRLHLDDLSAIPFLDNVVGVEAYQLRARVRAGEGDLYTATCPDMPDYEAYCREALGLGAAEFVYAEPVGQPIRVAAAAARGEALRKLCARAESAGALAIHPYMGNVDVWDLGATIATQARVPVKLLAPPPAATWVANDKWLMHRLGDELAPLLGRHPCVPTLHATTPEQAAEALTTMAAAHHQVALKMTRCASAMGNRVFESATVLGWTEEERAAQVAAFLEEKRWESGGDILIVAWLQTRLSPSSQTWIQYGKTAGDRVRVDGLYEQLLLGHECVFEGSVPAQLEPEHDAWLRRVSKLYGAAFEALGYRGRCSFDFIIHDGTPYLVEVNGRWGGTSTPMHLVDRVLSAGPDSRPAYRAKDILVPGGGVQGSGWSFQRLRDTLSDHLFDRQSGRGSYLLYNVGPLPTYGKFDVIAMGTDAGAADAALDALSGRLERGG